MQNNVTSVKEFYLLGFTLTPFFEHLLFSVILIIYITGLIINISIIAIVSSVQSLHKPMYFFISVFSFLEVWYPTVTVPGLLRGLLLKRKDISFGFCITQLYFHFALGGTENIHLVVLAFDRYVAICKPLHYVYIMNPRVCVLCALGTWIGGFLIPLIQCIFISKVKYCGSNIIEHYYCDFAPLMQLGCSDTSNLQTASVFFFGLILISFMLIIVSYIFIVRTVLALPKSAGRSKAFYTCASHLTVVLLFYGTIIFMFVRPAKNTNLHTNKIVSIFPSVVTPVLNPIIYTLRNQDVKTAVWRAFCR